MLAKDWWPLFPLLFLIVLSCLIAMIVRLWNSRQTTRTEWATALLAITFYILTFALGKFPSWHRPVSNVAELFILYNGIYFVRKGRSDIFWLNIVALLAIGADFALHYILK